MIGPQKKPTKWEQDRITAMLRTGCICCEFDRTLWGDWPEADPECHHIVEGNKRLGHAYCLPLCPGHHRREWSKAQRQYAAKFLHPLIGIGSGRKAFMERYPSERDLWEQVNMKLLLESVWPSSKIVPRKTA